jgi:hypothetical protein
LKEYSNNTTQKYEWINIAIDFHQDLFSEEPFKAYAKLKRGESLEQHQMQGLN